MAFDRNILRRRALALDGDKEAIASFARRGINMDALRQLDDDELILRVCQHLVSRSFRVCNAVTGETVGTLEL